MSDNSRLLEGLILGAIVGVAAGMLLAPASGEETQAKIKEKAKGLKDSIDEKIDGIDTEPLNDLKDKFSDIKESASEEYKKVAERVKELEKEIEEKIASLRKQSDNLDTKTT